MSVWNFTIDDSSPFFTYAPYADGSNSGLTRGWEPWYAASGFISKNGQGGEGDSYHLTSLDGASVKLDFYGTAIYFYGTANSSYDISLDNTAYSPGPATSDLLVSIADLKEGTHTVTLTARPTSSSQQLAFDRAVVSTPLVTNQTPTEAFYDNTDTNMLKYTGDWKSATAPGIPNATVTHPWQETVAEGASVAMDVGVGAVGVSLWGMANWGNWIYTVSIDGGTPNSYNGSTFWKVPDALLFYQGGLDPAKTHTVTLTNATPNMKLALNSIRVHHLALTQNATTVPSSSTSSVVTPSATNTSTSPAHSTVGAGVIAGPIIGVALVALLCGLWWWWRSRRTRLNALSTSRNMTQSDAYTDRSPHRPLFPSTGYSAVTSTTGLTSSLHSPVEPLPTTQVSGPRGATVMTWGAAPYHDEEQGAHARANMSSNASHAYSTTSPSSYTPNSNGTSSDRPGPVPVGKMRAPPPPPAPMGLDAPDVDRLIELIAQRIDQGRGQHDDVAPPEYHG
ncbi:hypothetical protein DFH09DRAFT_1127808 [Mycena vulgaris]|nr:hypothetical protein DFH09DRAFT_1127808 [Mycena vulgaris]